MRKRWLMVGLVSIVILSGAAFVKLQQSRRPVMMAMATREISNRDRDQPTIPNAETILPVTQEAQDRPLQPTSKVAEPSLSMPAENPLPSDPGPSPTLSPEPPPALPAPEPTGLPDGVREASPEPLRLPTRRPSVVEERTEAVHGEDPMGAVDSFLERNRKEAEDSIKALTLEAESLRGRLQKVEAALARWQGVAAALTPPVAKPAVVEPEPAPLETIPPPSKVVEKIAPPVIVETLPPPIIVEKIVPPPVPSNGPVEPPLIPSTKPSVPPTNPPEAGLPDPNALPRLPSNEPEPPPVSLPPPPK